MHVARKVLWITQGREVIVSLNQKECIIIMINIVLDIYLKGLLKVARYRIFCIVFISNGGSPSSYTILCTKLR